MSDSKAKAKTTTFEDIAALYERIAADLGLKSDEGVTTLIAGIERPDDSIRTHLNAIERAVQGMASAEKTRKAP
jgi:hypothetical protein